METAHNVDARNLYDTKNVMITIIKLLSGQLQKKHITSC